MKHVNFFVFNSKICNDCIQERNEVKEMEDKAKSFYREFSGKRGEVIPSDFELSRNLHIPVGNFEIARRELSSEGFEYELLKTEQYQVVKTPYFTTNGVVKIFSEEISDEDWPTDFRGRGATVRWKELHELIESMKVGEKRKLTFDDYTLSRQVLAAAQKYCKTNRSSFMISGRVEPKEKGAPKYYIYMCKKTKNPNEWGKGPRAGTKNKV